MFFCDGRRGQRISNQEGYMELELFMGPSLICFLLCVNRVIDHLLIF